MVASVPQQQSCTFFSGFFCPFSDRPEKTSIATVDWRKCHSRKAATQRLFCGFWSCVHGVQLSQSFGKKATTPNSRTAEQPNSRIPYFRSLILHSYTILNLCQNHHFHPCSWYFSVLNPCFQHHFPRWGSRRRRHARGWHAGRRRWSTSRSRASGDDGFQQSPARTYFYQKEIIDGAPVPIVGGFHGLWWWMMINMWYIYIWVIYD